MRPKRALTTERQSDPSHCRRILRKTAFQSCHQIDDRWRCDNLPGFDGQARQLGLDQRSQRLLIPVAVRARVTPVHSLMMAPEPRLRRAT